MTNSIYDEGSYVYNIVKLRIKSIIGCWLPMKERFEIGNEIFHVELAFVDNAPKIYVHAFSKTDDGDNTINMELTLRFRKLARTILTAQRARLS